jgi:hypothetical protein
MPAPSLAPAPTDVGPERDPLLSRCGAVIDGAEAEPLDPPVDAADPHRSEYRTPTPLAPAASLAVTPRGTILLERGGAIWIVSADGRRRRTLVPATVPHGTPRWMPGGESLVFATRFGDPRWRVVVLDARCRDARVIGGPLCEAACDSPESDVSASPDGRFVVVAKGGWEDPHVVEIDVASGTERVLAHDVARSFSWSPDGRRLAWAAGGAPAALVVFDRETGMRVTLEHAVGSDHCSPVFGPDGRTLWFGESRSFAMVDISTDLYRLELPTNLGAAAKAAPSITLVDALGVHGWIDIRVSPDGARLATRQEWRTGGLGAPWQSLISVRSTALVGSKARVVGSALSSPHHNVVGPVFSPDGRLLAFTIGYCSNASCSGGTNRTVIDDGSTEFFVAMGRVSDWTAREFL